MDRQSATEIVFPKGTVYMRLSWEFKRFGEPAVPEWQRILDQHADLANGWTSDELRRMQRFLAGKVILLDGLVRIMPSPASSISVTTTVEETKRLLQEAEAHIAAGRLPILKDSTKERLLEQATTHERLYGGGISWRKAEPQQPLFN
jgi:hypothetical protein